MPPFSQNPIQVLAFVSAQISLLCSLSGAMAVRAARATGDDSSPGRGLARIAHVVALLFGVLPGILLLLILVIRAVYAGLDLMFATASDAPRVYGYGPEGLWTLGILFVSCVVPLASTRDRRLFTCALWIAVMAATWACLLLPIFPTYQSGRLRGGGTVAMVVSLSVLLLLAELLSRWIEGRWRERPGVAPRRADGATTSWPGLRASCGIIAVSVLLLVCYQLAVPTAVIPAAPRLTTLFVAIAACVGAWAVFRFLSRAWSGRLADAAMGLASLALCAFAVALVPEHPVLLAERYPLIFCAMIVALGLATAFWTWFSLERSPVSETAEAEAVAGRLASRAKRSAFRCAALATLFSVLLTVWPRLRGIATTDDTFSHMTAGIAADLFLLLVILWSSRHLRRLTFHILAVLTMLSTAGFVLVRMLPFSPGFG